MNNVPELGKLIDGEAHRDAIHVAVAPVVAGVDLEPGQHVGLFSDGTAKPTLPHIGIVDPYLRGRVSKGERFWLCLYPGTVTSLRHAWTHPALPGEAGDSSGVERQRAEAWLRAYAMRMNIYDSPDKAFNGLIDGLKTGELFAHGSDLHNLDDLDDAEELRVNAEAFLGWPIKGWGEFTFSCSC